VPLPKKVDVAVIGAGISGVSTAYHIARARPDLSVVILDARNVSGGATGRNGGLVHPASLWEIPVLAKEHGLVYAIQYFLLERATRQALRELDECLPGPQTLERDVDKIMLFEDEEAMHAKLGLGFVPLGKIVSKFKILLRPFGLEIWDKEECHSQMRLRSATEPAVVGAVCIPRSTDTVNASEIVTRLLHHAVLEHGVMLCPYTTVEAVSRTDPLKPEQSVTITTPKGQLEARHVVFATNAWTPRIVPETLGKIVPARNHVVCFEPSESLCRNGRNAGFGGLGNNYWVQRPDGRVICGGFRHLVEGGEEGIDDDAVCSDEIMESDQGPRKFLEGNYELNPLPQPASSDTGATSADAAGNEGSAPVGEAAAAGASRIEAEWSGIIANSSDGIPFVGPLDPHKRPGEYIVAGFSGHGMTTALLCGQAVAGMITGEPEPRTPWAPTRVCHGAMSPAGRLG